MEITLQDTVVSYNKRMRSSIIFWGILALGVIPVLTLLVGTQDNVLTTSMSAMGSSSGLSFVLFVIWTIAFCVFFASMVGYILMLTRNNKSKVRKFVYFAVGVLIFGNVMPFVPDVLPGFAALHDFCAKISSVTLAVSIMLLALTFRKHYRKLFWRSFVFVLIIWTVLIVMMGTFSTKSITEMTALILGSVFLFTVLVWLYKENAVDAEDALLQNDAMTAEEQAVSLEKRAKAAYDEYLKLDNDARRARLYADEYARIVKKDQAR